MATASQAAATVRALELAYRYLNRRERTTHELRCHLLGRDLDPAGVEAAVAELTEAGYVDDARFARLFTEDKRELQQWGTARIRRALLSLGIDRDIVDAALAEPGGTSLGAEPAARCTRLAESMATGGELERAVALLERRFPDPPRERRERQRALGMLLRRGYELDLALEALATHTRDEI
jgi:regulatory protein